MNIEASRNVPLVLQAFPPFAAASFVTTLSAGSELFCPERIAEISCFRPIPEVIAAHSISTNPLRMQRAFSLKHEEILL